MRNMLLNVSLFQTLKNQMTTNTKLRNATYKH